MPFQCTPLSSVQVFVNCVCVGFISVAFELFMALSAQNPQPATAAGWLAGWFAVYLVVVVCNSILPIDTLTPTEKDA